MLKAVSGALRAVAASPGNAEAALRKIAKPRPGCSMPPASASASRKVKSSRCRSASARAPSRSVQSLCRSGPDVQSSAATTCRYRGPRKTGQIHLPDSTTSMMSSRIGLASPVARRAGIRTMIGTPLRTKGNAIGALIVYRRAAALRTERTAVAAELRRPTPSSPSRTRGF